MLAGNLRIILCRISVGQYGKYQNHGGRGFAVEPLFYKAFVHVAAGALLYLNIAQIEKMAIINLKKTRGIITGCLYVRRA